MELNTYFYNEKHERVASLPGMVPVTKGVIVKTHDGSYVIDEIQIHLDNKDPYNGEELGFRVFCLTNT